MHLIVSLLTDRARGAWLANGSNLRTLAIMSPCLMHGTLYPHSNPMGAVIITTDSQREKWSSGSPDNNWQSHNPHHTMPLIMTEDSTVPNQPPVLLSINPSCSLAALTARSTPGNITRSEVASYRGSNLSKLRETAFMSEFIHSFSNAAYSMASDSFISFLCSPIIATCKREYLATTICLPAREEHRKGNAPW